MRKTSEKLLQPIFAFKRNVKCHFVHSERIEKVKINHDLMQDQPKTTTSEVYGKVTLDGKTYENANGWRFSRQSLLELPWSGFLVVIGRKRNETVLQFLKSDRSGILACRGHQALGMILK